MKSNKPKQPFTPILSAMFGNKILFNGTFGRGEQDRLMALAEAQQGIVVTKLDASVNIAVIADATPAKTVLQKVKALNAKGAAIRVLKAAEFLPLVLPTEPQIVQLIKGGAATAAIFAKVAAGSDHSSGTPVFTFKAESFDGADLSGFDFGKFAFSHCGFVGCALSNAAFTSAADCDFTRATGESAEFQTCADNRFHEAVLSKPRFMGSMGGCDFTAARVDGGHFAGVRWTGPGRIPKNSCPVVFARSAIHRVVFHDELFNSADLDQADMTGCTFMRCRFEAASLSGTILRDVVFQDCALFRANLNGSNLSGADLAGSDLTGTTVDGADVGGCSFRGATIDGVDFANAKNYDPQLTGTGTIGPALAELDSLLKAAKRIAVTFQVRGGDGQCQDVGVDSRLLRYGFGLRVPSNWRLAASGRGRASEFSAAMCRLAKLASDHKVRFETVEVSSTKSPKAGKALRDVVLAAIAEAFAQPIPPAAELAAAVKAFREEAREQTAADRERRETAKKLAEKQKLTAKRQIAKKIEKEVGRVTDIATFLKALELRADKSKIDKATKMLKAEKFQLFNDITESHLNGVVKSQTDPDLVYACRIESGGQYACCTQNLNICGGLRGSICKHLLVLIIGLVKAGQLDPSDIDGWIAKTHDTKPELNKETMGEIFIRYKGAEAGEVDWRPTETVPEDYYAV
jgi:uncharacterized protein YjbI with pentapeptide repeats